LPISCDVSVHQLHLIDVDIGYFDAAMRLSPPLRQQRDREAIRTGLRDGTIDALVSDHTPVDADAKNLPFAQAEPGASALELLLGLALKWGHETGLSLPQTLASVTSRPAALLVEALGSLASGVGKLAEGGAADLCLFDAAAFWTVKPSAFVSQAKHTPFAGIELPGRVAFTLVGGQVAFEAQPR
jgi:dihydroorotase